MHVLAAALAAAAAVPGAPAPPGLPASYHHAVLGARRVAEAAIVLPAPFPEIADLLWDVHGYPAWLLAAPDGSPQLTGLVVDDASGAVRVLLGSGQDALHEGQLVRSRTETSCSIRVVSPGTRVKETILEATASPDASDPARTRVAFRCEVTLGVGARLFGGNAKEVPSLLPLLLRNDFAARVLMDPARLAILGLQAEPRAGGLVLAAPPPGARGRVELVAGDTIRRVEPAVLRLAPERAGAFRRYSGRIQDGRKVSFDEYLDEVHAALEGDHVACGLLVTALSGGSTATILSAPGPADVTCRVSFTVRDGRAELSLGVAPVE